jgi:AcrR family transcriptional regulator
MKSKRPYHHPDLRQAILENALGELAEQGVRKFSLRSVAQKTGVSHTAVYRHFASKDDILSTLIVDGMKRLTLTLKTAASQPARRAKDRLTEQGRAYIAFARAYPEHIAIMFSELGFSALKREGARLATLEPDAHDAFLQLELVVRACQAEGSLDPAIDSGMLAMLIWSMIHGLALLLKEGVIGDMAATRGISAARIEDLLIKAFASFFR